MYMNTNTVAHRFHSNVVEYSCKFTDTQNTDTKLGLLYHASWSRYNRTRVPMVLYGSPERWGYAELEQAWKYMIIFCTSFHPCRSIRKQIWPCHKNGQGQLRVIIWINLVVPEYPMLYTKFQGHWFWRRRFLNVFTIYGRGSHLCHVPGSFEQIFIPTSHRRCIRNSASNVQVIFCGKEVWKCWIWVTLVKGQCMTFTFGGHKSSHLFIWLYVLSFISQASVVSQKPTA